MRCCFFILCSAIAPAVQFTPVEGALAQGAAAQARQDAEAGGWPRLMRHAACLGGPWRSSERTCKLHARRTRSFKNLGIESGTGVKGPVGNFPIIATKTIPTTAI